MQLPACCIQHWKVNHDYVTDFEKNDNNTEEEAVVSLRHFVRDSKNFYTLRFCAFTTSDP
jgi:hypothetical protein